MKQNTVSIKPIIGILANVEVIDKQLFQGQDLTSLRQDYIHAVIKAGGNPVILPIVNDPYLIRQQIELIDGLLLSGGSDVHPLFYGEEPHPDLGYVHPTRDRYEIEALLIAYQQKKPVFGICRGLQVMNVAFDGSLYQDLAHANPSLAMKHSQLAPMHVAWHMVDVFPDTHLQHLLGKNSIGTNSFHHQAIKRLAQGFIISAKTKDGVIEGIEKSDYPFMIGVQWHPERMIDHDPDMLKLFETFVKKAKIYHEHK